MGELTEVNGHAGIPATSESALVKVRQFQDFAREQPQVPFVTEHVIHAGIYTRTVRMPPGTMIVGVLVKVPTILMVMGDVSIFTGQDVIHLSGYNLVPASAGRKQIFVNHSYVCMTMMFATDAKTVEDAQKQFTDELHLLPDHTDEMHNITVITGE